MSKWRSRGFTLVELLVVIAIIGILVSLTVPAVQQARETARKMSCSNNLKQIGLAIHHYHATYQTFPPSSTSDVEQGGWIYYPQRRHIHSWSSLVLPFLDLSNVANSIDYTVSSLHPNNLSAGTTVIRFIAVQPTVAPSLVLLRITLAFHRATRSATMSPWARLM